MQKIITGEQNSFASEILSKDTSVLNLIENKTIPLHERPVNAQIRAVKFETVLSTCHLLTLSSLTGLLLGRESCMCH